MTLGSIFSPPQSAPLIGAETVTKLAAALHKFGLTWLTPPLYAEARMTNWLVEPPRDRIDAENAARVHQALRATLPTEEARIVLSEAGRMTAEHLLDHRIPAFVIAALRRMPTLIAIRSMAALIKLYSSTIAGDGQIRISGRRPVAVEIVGNALCKGETADHVVCAWHAALFERLFDAVAPSRVRVIEAGCEARGDPAGRFLVVPI